MPWPETGATNSHAKLGLPDKGRAILWFCPMLLPKDFFGRIPYSAHGAQITPPPLFLIFRFFSS